MLKWLRKRLSSEEVIQLRKRVVELEEKLVESQKNIDRTNAYWKRKYFAVSKKS